MTVTEGNLDGVLQRSDDLHEAILNLLEDAEFEGSARGIAALGMASVALEHASSLRMLIALGLATSAVGMMRLQFETLTRAMWLLYVASDEGIAKLSAPLTVQSEQAAKNLPSVVEMIDQIGRGVDRGVPAAAHQMLVNFKDVSWHAMNSFVHGGIHPLRRQVDGFPLPLTIQVVRNSNGLLTMTGMVLAILSGDAEIGLTMSEIQPKFADCLPDLLR